MQPRAAIYARISESDKKAPAIANQVANCEELAAREGYRVVRVFSDDGISAYSGKERPGFLDLVRGVRAREFDVILAVAEDRLTRSSSQKMGFQSDCVKAAVTWHTLASGKVDPGTAAGGLMATLTGAVAEYESALKAERQQRSVQDRLAAGKDLGGGRPFGYEPDRVTVRDAEAALVREGCQMILEGGTIYGVARAWDKTGVRPPRAQARWRTQTVRSILLRPRNAGVLEVKGTQYPTDRIEAIVSAEDFEAVTAILTNPARAPRRGPKPSRSSASGLVRCGLCGSHLQQTASKGKRAMRCAREGRIVEGRHPTLLVESMETALAESALMRVLDRAADGLDLTTAHTEVPALRLQIADLVRQRDVQQQLAAAPGANVALALKELARLGQAIETADRDLDAALSADTGTAALEMARAFIAKLPEGVLIVEGGQAREPWLNLWSGLSIDQRQQLLRALFDSIELIPRRRGSSVRLRLDGQDLPDPTSNPWASEPF